MLEYLFFDQRPFDQFLKYLKTLALTPQQSVSDCDEYLVGLFDDGPVCKHG